MARPSSTSSPCCDARGRWSGAWRGGWEAQTVLGGVDGLGYSVGRLGVGTALQLA